MKTLSWVACAILWVSLAWVIGTLEAILLAIVLCVLLVIWGISLTRP